VPVNLLAEKPNFIALKTNLLALTFQGCFFYAGLFLKDSAVIFEQKSVFWVSTTQGWCQVFS
jgi:hypothetical protein